LLAKTAEDKGCEFHPRCLKLRLNHLCFADDLLIFCAAHVQTIQALKKALQNFEELLGLKANPAKSSAFCSGVSQQEKAWILDCLQMEEGHFPVWYLVVLLISTKLSQLIAVCLLILGWRRVLLLLGDFN
jgi:hypothetical protein